MSHKQITLNVNGEEHHLDVPVHKLLLAVLRGDLELGGARESCGIGMCGACTVLVDGRAVSACLTLAVQVDGSEITTIEGLDKEGKLHPVQQAFIDRAAFQCAYCTPGFILSTITLLDENPEPSDDDIREYLSGNLCRCGSYVHILEAVKQAARNRLQQLS